MSKDWQLQLKVDHGIAVPSAMIDECEQTAEGISKEMFDNESFESWYVLS